MDREEMIKRLRETPAEVAQEMAEREPNPEVVVSVLGKIDYLIPRLLDPNPDKMDFSLRVYEAGISGRQIRNSTREPALRDAAENLRQVAYKELKAAEQRQRKDFNPDWEETLDYAKVAAAAQKVLDLGASQIPQ